MTDDVATAGGAEFASARPKLMAIAYRMLGSAVEAEDVVGDVALRWSATDRSVVEVPEAWLVTATTRRALDVLRSARLQREHYPGVWLPEPIATGDGPGELVERRESLTMGFLLLLERLTPIERAVLVLHDALGHGYGEIAAAVGRSEAACRQACRRARRHVEVPAMRSDADRLAAADVAGRFLAVAAGGDVDAFLAVLSPDIVVTSDGGGVVHAAMRPVTGRHQAARLLANLTGRVKGELRVFPLELNGAPGSLVHGGLHDRPSWGAFIVEPAGEAVAAVYVVVNPAKLERLIATIPQAADLPGPWETGDHFRHRQGRPVTLPRPR